MNPWLSFPLTLGWISYILVTVLIIGFALGILGLFVSLCVVIWRALQQTALEQQIPPEKPGVMIMSSAVEGGDPSAST